MAWSAETIAAGKAWEKEAHKVLLKLFSKVEPLYNYRRKVDFIVEDKTGRRFTVECKMSNGNHTVGVYLGDKDIGADFLLLKLRKKKYFYKRCSLK